MGRKGGKRKEAWHPHVRKSACRNEAQSDPYNTSSPGQVDSCWVGARIREESLNQA